jgi:hypothetical protein
MVCRLMTTMRWLKRGMLIFILLFILPLALHAAWWLAQDRPASWSQASWSSAGLLEPATLREPALVRIYAARVGRWRGIFAHHTWIVVKEKGAPRYTRYDVVGWGSPVRTDNWAPDGRWFGQVPDVVAAIDGPAAEVLVPRIRAAVAAYPWADLGGYQAWPGPNSNTFVNMILAAIPEAGVALPPTALGKDFRSDGLFAGPTPSRTGVQVAWRGLVGASVGWVEGVELNVLGLVAGLDLRRPALKLPGFGRIGVAASPLVGTATAAPRSAP